MRAAAQRAHARTVRNIRRLTGGGPAYLVLTNELLRARLKAFRGVDDERQAILRDLFRRYPRAFETQPRR